MWDGAGDGDQVVVKAPKTTSSKSSLYIEEELYEGATNQVIQKLINCCKHRTEKSIL